MAQFKDTHLEEMLFDKNLVIINPSHPVTLPSGIMTPIYLKCSDIMSYPFEQHKMMEALYSTIKNHLGEGGFDIVAGTDIPLTTCVQQYFHVPMCYVRKEAKDHGLRLPIEGAEIRPGQRVVFVEDVFSTGESTAEAVKSITSAGGVVDLCAVICDFQINSASQNLSKLGVTVRGATTMDRIFDYGLSHNRISTLNQRHCQYWRHDPMNWTEMYKNKMLYSDEQISKEMARIILGIEAVTIHPDGIRYASGTISPVYTNLRKLIGFPVQRERVAQLATAVIDKHIGFDNFDSVAGVPSAGEPLATDIATMLGIPLIRILKKPNFEGRQYEGNLRLGTRILLVEDLISTFGSAVEAIEPMRVNGAKVEHCIAIVDYQMKKSAENIKKCKVDVKVMTYFPVIIEEAALLNEEITSQKEMLLDWGTDHENWAKKHGITGPK